MTASRRAPALAVSALLAAAGTPGADAQVPKELLLGDLERDRRNVLAFIDAMPDSLLRFRPTPGVRDFTRQIEHICVDNMRIVSTALRDGADPPTLGDPALYLDDREALREWAARSFDWVIDVVRGTPEEELRGEGVVFGRYRMPRWRAVVGAREHAAWTLGQLIPYLRLNGIEPPTYELFRRPP